MSETKLTRLLLTNFTAFRNLDLRLSPGVNVLVGTNGTGKTHILKLLYDACAVTTTRKDLPQKLVADFMPDQGRIGRLVHRRVGTATAAVTVERGTSQVEFGFNSRAESAARVVPIGLDTWLQVRTDCAYIPVKEMLANAPGFRSLYDAREIQFEEVYADIIGRALTPPRRGLADAPRKKLLKLLEGTIEGKVVTQEEQFFLKNDQGSLEFSLLAEGMRKLGLIWKLIQNGTLLEGSVLFWDEPEANLNPSVLGQLVEILLELHRLDVQIFLATHNYVVLKEFDLRARGADRIRYHALYRDQDAALLCSSTDDYDAIEPNAIADTFVGLYDREVERVVKGEG